VKITEALSQLRSALPTEAFEGPSNADDQSRATLKWLVERALTSSQADPVAEDPSTCPNCGKPMLGEKSPYCSVQCREEAGFIRQFRRTLIEGAAFENERQASLGQVFWHVIGGGYPRRQTLVTEKERKRIFNRYEGKCQVCGAEATTFDHIGSACNRTSNLRSVCWNCTTTRPFGDPEFLAKPDINALANEIAARVGSETPIRCCDDPETWDWRAYVRSRR